MRLTCALILLIANSLLGLTQAIAAPCCAGSTALPSLITGDESKLINLSVSYGTVVGEAFGAMEGKLPEFHDDLSNREVRQNLNLNYAMLVSDLYQLGISVPMVRNHMELGSRADSRVLLGDVSFTGGFEVLPEYEYTLWVPRVYIFSQLFLPTGHSMQLSEAPLGTDVAGLAQWQFHLGSAAIKRWSNWDAMAILKMGRIFSKNFNPSSGDSIQVGGSWGLNASLSGGYSFADRYRIGMSLEPQYQSPVETLNSIGVSSSSQKLAWNTGLTATALVGADSSLVLGYSDQTLFGPAINTTLARTFSFTYQRRFER